MELPEWSAVCGADRALSIEYLRAYRAMCLVQVGGAVAQGEEVGATLSAWQRKYGGCIAEVVDGLGDFGKVVSRLSSDERGHPSVANRCVGGGGRSIGACDRAESLGLQDDGATAGVIAADVSDGAVLRTVACEFAGEHSGSLRHQGGRSEECHDVPSVVKDDERVPEWRRDPPRGPNFERNQASRQKKKNKKLYEQCFQRKVDADDELAAEVRRMRLERQKIQEQRKLDKLKSPVQMIEDAMKQVALAEKYAKLANDSKVAEWAAKLSSASAESIALSAGAKSTDVGSGKVSSVGTSYTKAVVDKFSVKKCPMTISEKTAVDVKVVRVDQIESLRRKINRTLTARDFMFADFPHPITMAQKVQIREAEDFCDTENIPIIEF